MYQQVALPKYWFPANCHNTSRRNRHILAIFHHLSYLQAQTVQCVIERQKVHVWNAPTHSEAFSIQKDSHDDKDTAASVGSAFHSPSLSSSWYPAVPHTPGSKSLAPSSENRYTLCAPLLQVHPNMSLSSGTSQKYNNITGKPPIFLPQLLHTSKLVLLAP